MFGYTNKGIKGAILLDNQHVADTMQCVHCGGHFIVQRGSGKIRGFCHNCSGPTCGVNCDNCVPFEKYLEITESYGH